MIADTTTPIHGMSASAYQVLCDYLGLGDLPTILRVIPRGFRESERRTVVESAWRELRDTGLADQRGPDQELVKLITVLHRFDYSIDARLHLGGEIRALAAAQKSTGVLAVLANDRLTVREMHPDNLCAAIVGLLPQLAAGPGRSLSFPRNTLEEAATGQGAHNVAVFETQLRAAGISQDVAGEVSTILGNSTRRGNFGVTVTTEYGRRLRGDHMLAWLDTEHGRYLIEDSKALDDQTWTTIAPADPTRLTSQLTHLLATTQSPRVPFSTG